MGRVRQAGDEGLYGRVLQRLSHALAEAEHRAGAADAERELEVQGLSAAELAFIQAYLSGDARWLSGWHAAAEEQALIERQTSRPSLRALRARTGWRGRNTANLQRNLACALCGAEVRWPDGPGPVTCGSCGSHLLRGRQQLGSRRH
ncbi:hypothetical protein [Stutzerimonas azotifigens]|uniref:hypothetical protein n=1 Tax=Stutzerimonas azotifigens TaxID=291995 RepID=UPI0004082AE6|nr:hypothetical protein [Stutzerimonas azotifigens]